MLKKIQHHLAHLGEILEHLMAIIVIISVAVAIFSLWEPFSNFFQHRAEPQALIHFMESVLDIIIGIELFKMLCRPGAGTVLEVMMFCISRHMIVHNTTAVENLLTIISVSIIIIIKKYFASSSSWSFPKKKNKKDSEA